MNFVVVRLLLRATAMQKAVLRAGVFLFVGGLWSLAGCGTSVREEQAPCRTDDDCAAGEQCEPLAEAKRSVSVAAPCMPLLMMCSEDADCSSELVCWPSERVVRGGEPGCYVQPTVCGPKCPTTPCLDDEVCEESGHCRMTRCDEPDAPECPAHWECDPEAALLEPETYAQGAEGESVNFRRDIARGCARLRCDEPGGFVCKEGWSCDPENATDPSGCVALGCKELGHCSDDALFICEPTDSPATRPAGEDAHGCVARTCDEGFVCDASSICEPDTGEAELRGCRLLNCEEGATCNATQYCDPRDPNANPLGCVYAPPMGTGGNGSGGNGSGGGSAAEAGSGGSPTGAGGSGGGRPSGSGGVSTAGSGGTTATSGTGGSDASEAPPGRCVAR